MKTCFWDMETTDLDCDWARILTCGIKPLGRKPLMMVNKSLFKNVGEGRSDDREIVVAIRNLLEAFDLVVSYYGGPWRFDLPMLNSRLLVHDEAPLSPKFHLDLYSYVKRNLRLRMGHRRLADVANFFGWPEKKTMMPTDWVQLAMDGDKKALKRILARNKGDVILLEKLYPKLKSYVRALRRVS